MSTGSGGSGAVGRLMPVSVGVDLSLRSCGVAAVRDDFVVESRQINVPSGLSKWDKLRYIGQVLDYFLRSYSPSVVVFENVRLFHGGKVSIDAIRDLARLQGVVGFLSAQFGVPAVEVATQHWRRVVLGNGLAKKKEVVDWAKDFSRVDGLGVDEAEAIALAKFGIIYLEQQTQRSRSIRRSVEVASSGSNTRRRPRSVDRGGRKRQIRRQNTNRRKR